MHDWSEEDFDWQGLNDAGEFIGAWLRKWVRMEVCDIKEKFGTLRIYCGFGWSSLYSIWRPHYCWIPKWWPYKLDRILSNALLPILNPIVARIQMKAYTWRYKKAVEKWPHLKEEILCCADWRELLGDIK